MRTSGQLKSIGRGEPKFFIIALMTAIENAATESTELIFLSHSGADTEAAKSLASLLRQGGVDVWLDVERLAPGDVWMDQLEAALVAAKHFIVYIGPSGVRNWF